MPNVWFNGGNGLRLTTTNLAVASYGAAAAVRDHVQAQQKPKQLRGSLMVRKRR